MVMAGFICHSLFAAFSFLSYFPTFLSLFPACPCILLVLESWSLGLLLGEPRTRQRLAKNSIVAFLLGYLSMLGYHVSLSTASLRELLTSELISAVSAGASLEGTSQAWLSLSLANPAILHNEVKSMYDCGLSRTWVWILTLLFISLGTLENF